MATTPGQANPSSTDHDTYGPPGPAEQRAQAPIRWPRPDGRTLTLIGLWFVGLLVALALPATIVPPSAPTAAAGELWLAFGITVVGVAVMLVAATGLWRRHREPIILVMVATPAISCLLGGIILVATKGFSGNSGYGGGAG
jgi:hypothetical protein